ncbi:MAG TPA: HTH domain-containing protein [Acetobacteraceae bacterium]|nr:HTH domain-containing protein [Acetobacteraceae bacterium]
MLDILGSRQKELIRSLLGALQGLSVDALAQRLGITRNAVRQHLAALGNDGLVSPGGMRASGGRPEQLYLLTDKGRELFPRGYSWFAALLMKLVRKEHGREGLRERLGRLGAEVAAELRQRHPEGLELNEAVDRLAALMAELGYEAAPQPGAENPPTIEASNCIFHQLAMQDPDICAFDLALLSGFTGATVEHQECMARGGAVCRFGFKRPE